MEKHYRTDFRIIIFMQYIFIGGGDVVFWWTVWNIADYANPIRVISNGHITFIHGYVFVIIANACYLTTRKCFRRTLDKFLDVTQQELYPSSIVTITTRKAGKRTRKYILITFLFPVCVYFLGLGFIHIWRGVFAVFNYLVEDVLFEKGINTILSRILLQLCIGLTLIFNQKNNAVNLCPTHKMFKFDELQYLEILFKMHILNIPTNSITKHYTKMFTKNEQVITNLDTGAEVLPNDNVKLDIVDDEIQRTFDPFNHQFNLVLYFATFFKKFHKPKESKIFPKRILSTPMKCYCNPTDHVRVNIDILAMISRSCGINLSENVGLLSDDIPASVESNEFPADTCLCMYVEIYQTKNKEEEYEVNGDDVNDNASIETKEHDPTDVKLVETLSSQQRKCPCGSVIVKKFVKKVTPKNPKDRDILTSDNYHRVDRMGNDIQMTLGHQVSQACNKKCLHCRIIHLCAYIYTIHYEHVLLNALGAIFWSSTWGVFATITKSIITNSAQDIPWLLLVAIMCHCINHMVLFRMKENSVNLRWRTFCEYLCGVNTVCFWASSWHVMDIFSMLFSNRLLILIVPHVTVFLTLSFFKVSINVVL